MSDKVIVGGDGVKGDITECKIEQQLKKTERGGAFSLVQNDTYITYDVCSKQIVDEYTVQNFTGFAGGLASVLLCLAVVIGFIGMVRWAYEEEAEEKL